MILHLITAMKASGSTCLRLGYAEVPSFAGIFGIRRIEHAQEITRMEGVHA
jgi:hypothetical protein